MIALLFTLALPAAAQEPAEEAAAPSVGATVWLTEAVEAPRFPNRPTPTVSLAAEDQVQVFFVEGERVRVKRGTTWGWVPRAALSSSPPEGVELQTESPLLSAPSLQGGGSSSLLSPLGGSR